MPAEPEPDETGSGLWLLSLRFGPDMLRNGMDPSSFIRYLATIGEIEQIEAVATHQPAGADFNPETNYLRLEARYRSPAEQQTLADVFEFAREDSEVHIWPWPATPAQQAAALASADAAEAAAVRAVWLRLGLDADAPTAAVGVDADTA